MKTAVRNDAFQYEINVASRWWIVDYDAYLGFKGERRARIRRT